MTDRSGKPEGPTARTETADPLEFLAQVLVLSPDGGHAAARHAALARAKIAPYSGRAS